MKTNDVQERLIMETISSQHYLLMDMYHKRKALEEEHRKEFETYNKLVNNQEIKVLDLCAGRVTTLRNKDNGHLNLDLTNKES